MSKYSRFRWEDACSRERPLKPGPFEFAFDVPESSSCPVLTLRAEHAFVFKDAGISSDKRRLDYSSMTYGGSERTNLHKERALIAVIFAAVIGLAGCNHPPASTIAAASASPAADPLLKTPGDGILIGSGWFPLEHFKVDTFRWATNDAEVTACPDVNDRTLALELDPGPGINGQPHRQQI